MSRSLKKGIFCHNSLIKKVNNLLVFGGKKTIKTWSRSSTILKSFLGFTILVHNGKKHIPVYISSDKIGHKLGEFSLTRTFRKHTVLKKSKKIIL